MIIIDIKKNKLQYITNSTNVTTEMKRYSQFRNFVQYIYKLLVRTSREHSTPEIYKEMGL